MVRTGDMFCVESSTYDLELALFGRFYFSVSGVKKDQVLNLCISNLNPQVYTTVVVGIRRIFHILD